VQKLAAELTRQVMGKMQPRPGKTNGREPNVSVADVGTVRPDQMEDFE